MLTKLGELIARGTDVQTADPALKQKGQFLNIFILATLVFALVVTIIKVVQWVGHFHEILALLSAVAGVFICLFLIGLFDLNRSGYTRWVGPVFLGGFVTGITIVFPIQTLERLFLLYVIPTIAASFILSAPSSVFFASLSVLAYTLAYFISGAVPLYEFLFPPAIYFISFIAWLVSFRLEAALADALRSEAQIRTLVEQNPAVVYNAEPERLGSWTYVGPQIEALLGFTSEEWLSEPGMWLKQLHPDDKERLLSEDVNYTDGALSHAEYRLFARDGRSVWVSDDAMITGEPGEPLRRQGVLLDITERKRAETIQGAIYRISQAAYSPGSLEELYGSIRATLSEMMPAENFFIASYDVETDTLSFPYFIDEFDDRPPSRKLRRGLTDYVVRTGRPFFASPETYQDLIGQNEVELIGAPSIDWLGVPLNIKDRTIGVMAVQTYKEGRRYTKEDLNILTFVSNQVAMAIERKQVEQALRIGEERYRKIFEDAPLGIFQSGVNGEVLAINPAYVKIFGYQSEEDLRASVRDVARDLYVDPSLRKKYLKVILESKSSISVENEYRHKDGSTFTGRLHLWAVWDDEGHPQHLEGFIEDITDRRRAEELIKLQNAYLLTLNETALALMNRLDIDDVMVNIVQRSTQLFNTPHGFVYLVNDRDSILPELELKVGNGIFREQIGLRQKLNEGIGGKVLASGEVLVVDSMAHAGKHPELFAGKRFTAVVAVPLRSGRDVSGVLGLARTEPGSTFTPDEIDWINRFAHLASIALDNARLFTAAQRELAIRTMVEEALRESNQLNTEVISGVNAGIIVLDKQLRYLIWNSYMEKLMELPAEEVVGKLTSELFSNAHPGGSTEFLQQALSGVTVSTPDLQYKVTRSGKSGWYSGFYGPHRNADGEITGVIGVVNDITERKWAEEQITSALHEKEVLLREIHHRVKNNLQVISSLLSLQADKIHEPQVLDMFREMQARVRSMALVHEGLYRSQDLAQVNLAEYTQKLIASLFRVFSINPRVEIEVKIDEIFMGVDTAVPCGLIINELVSNALKYAFPDGKNGKVCVNVQMDKNAGDENCYTLTVSDDGIGFPENIDFNNTETLGMQLVNVLTRQLKGSIRIEREHGTTFVISFTERKGSLQAGEYNT